MAIAVRIRPGLFPHKIENFTAGGKLLGGTCCLTKHKMMIIKITMTSGQSVM